MSVAFLNSDPQLKRLLAQATKQQWDPTMFTAELKNTKWWKTNSDAQRKAALMQSQDPATYKANIEASRVAASQMAVKMGAILSDKAVDKLAHNIVHFGWQDAQIQNFLGAYIKFNDKHVIGGMAGQAFDQLRKTAYDNGVSLSEQQAKNSAAYVVKGVSTMENEVANIRGIAMGAYPAYADQIAAGQSMRDIAAPYVQALAKTLELPDTDVDMYHPKIKAALSRAGADGKPSPMSITDFENQLRDTPDWRKTQAAQNSVFNIGHQVLQNMGLVK